MLSIGERDGVVVAALLLERLACRAGVRLVGDGALEERAERLHGRRLLVEPRGRLLVREHEARLARRHVAAAAAIALRDPEREAQLEREVGAQEVRQIRAVGADDRRVVRVLTAGEVIEEEVPLPVAQDLVQRRPARHLAVGGVEELLDPCGIHVFEVAVPAALDGPEAVRLLRRGGRPGLEGDDGEALRGDALARLARALREGRVVEARLRRLDLGDEEVRRPAAARVGGRDGRRLRRGRLALLGGEDAELADERLLADGKDAQRRARPGRPRGDEEEDVLRVLALRRRVGRQILRLRGQPEERAVRAGSPRLALGHLRGGIGGGRRDVSRRRVAPLVRTPGARCDGEEGEDAGSGHDG